MFSYVYYANAVKSPRKQRISNILNMPISHVLLSYFNSPFEWYCDSLRILKLDESIPEGASSFPHDRIQSFDSRVISNDISYKRLHLQRVLWVVRMAGRTSACVLFQNYNSIRTSFSRAHSKKGVTFPRSALRRALDLIQQCNRFNVCVLRVGKIGLRPRRHCARFPTTGLARSHSSRARLSISKCALLQESSA